MMGTPNERAVIGAILLDGRGFRFAAEAMNAEDFSVLQFELMFTGMGKMLAAGEVIDPITVSNHFAEWEVRGLTFADLSQITTDTPHAGGVEWYAAAVHSEAVRRQITVAGQHALQGAQSSEFVAGEILARTIAEFQSIQSGAARSELEAKTLAQVLEGNDDYDWVIPDLMESRDRLVFTGAEGAGKSTFIRQMAILSASGVHPTTFDPIEPVRVLIVDSENSEQQWRRAAKYLVGRGQHLGKADPAQAVHLACAPRLDLTRDAHLGQIHKLIDQYQPQILFIGPLYRLTPRAINSDDDAAPLLAALDTVRDRGIALVMEAHAGHALGVGGERDLRPRGSAALMGWPEFGMGLRKTRDESGYYDVVPWRGHRDVRQWPELMRHGDRDRGEMPWHPIQKEDY